MANNALNKERVEKAAIQILSAFIIEGSSNEVLVSTAVDVAEFLVKEIDRRNYR